jgi:hypothetical protein
MSTKELQAAMMPTKRRRTARDRARTPLEFDIPVDSDAGEDGNDDSNFEPLKRGKKTRRKEPLSKPSTARLKASRGNVLGKADKQTAGLKSKTKKSTSTNFITATAPPALLTPSTSSVSRANRETKSPSQLSTVKIPTSKANKGRYGGSLRRRNDGEDKENRIQMEKGNDEAVGQAGVGSPPQSAETVAMVKNKWADIDAWDMDFEDVEVMTGESESSPMRR